MSLAPGELKKIGLTAVLRSCQLFTGLPMPDLESIADVAVVKSLAKGEYLFREGDPAIGFYVVQRGSVNVHRVNAAGKEQIIHVFRSGDSFAEVALASPKGYPADARVLEATQVLLVHITTSCECGPVNSTCRKYVFSVVCFSIGPTYPVIVLVSFSSMMVFASF